MESFSFFGRKTRGNESKLAEKYTREPRNRFKDIAYKINKLRLLSLCESPGVENAVEPECLTGRQIFEETVVDG
jgi:hypothetical protein